MKIIVFGWRLMKVAFIGAIVLVGLLMCSALVDTANDVTANAPGASTSAPSDPGFSKEAQEAIESANTYLTLTAFSKEGLQKQLKFDGYSAAMAKFAVNRAEADWNAEAVESAQNLLDLSGFSRVALEKQLKFNGFTEDQVTYALNKVFQ